MQREFILNNSLMNFSRFLNFELVTNTFFNFENISLEKIF